MNEILSVRELTYAFGQKKAVDGLSLSAGEGEIIGLLGPNGAGKTTTIRLMNGLYAPQPGSISVHGYDPASNGAEIRQISGVLTETPALYERLTARQNLEFFGALADLPPVDLKTRADALLNEFELADRANEPVSNYSKGMKQRLALARTLIADPKLLFLDEPTAGLDPEASQQVHAMIEEISARKNRTVLLCTHNLYEAERLCDRLVIIHAGQLLAFGTLDELRQTLGGGLRVEFVFENLWRQDFLPAFDGQIEAKWSDDTHLELRLADSRHIPDILSWFVSQNARLLACVPHQPSLEEVYFTLQQQVKEGRHETQ